MRSGPIYLQRLLVSAHFVFRVVLGALFNEVVYSRQPPGQRSGHALPRLLRGWGLGCLRHVGPVATGSRWLSFQPLPSLSGFPTLRKTPDLRLAAPRQT